MLTNEQISSLTNAQAAALQTNQIVALTNDHIGCAAGERSIQAMSMTQALAFSTEDQSLMSGAQLTRPSMRCRRSSWTWTATG